MAGTGQPFTGDSGALLVAPGRRKTADVPESLGPETVSESPAIVAATFSGARGDRPS